MAKKVFFIFLLALSLGAFLVLKPLFSKKPEAPTILDRLPDEEFIGRLNLIDFARESEKITEKNQVGVKDFLAHDFLLSQSKNYGIDLRKYSYVFGNSKGESGLIVELTDSSKIIAGINRLKIVYPIKDTLIGTKKVYVLKKENLYFFYDKSYAFVYKGNQISAKFKRIVDAKLNDQTPTWKDFLKDNTFKKDFFVVSTQSKKLTEFGLKKAVLSIHCDSTHFLIKTALNRKGLLNVSLKEKGFGFKTADESSSFLNLHVDITKFRDNPDDEFLQIINKFAKRISFPTTEFLNAWEGDISFIEGGVTAISETFIETQMDEEFNPIEVRKYKSVSVPKYAIMLSMNDKKESFFQLLNTKGILTQDGSKSRFLFSPPLARKEYQNYTVFNSGDVFPEIQETKTHSIFHTWNGKRYQFDLLGLEEESLLGEFKIHFTDLVNYLKYR
jgi:hypothetical protein